METELVPQSVRSAQQTGLQWEQPVEAGPFSYGRRARPHDDVPGSKRRLRFGYMRRAGRTVQGGGLQSRPETNCSLVSVKSAVKANSLSREDGVFFCFCFCFFQRATGVRNLPAIHSSDGCQINSYKKKNNALLFYFYDISRVAAKR